MPVFVAGKIGDTYHVIIQGFYVQIMRVATFDSTPSPIELTGA